MRLTVLAKNLALTLLAWLVVDVVVSVVLELTSGAPQPHWAAPTSLLLAWPFASRIWRDRSGVDPVALVRAAASHVETSEDIPCFDAIKAELLRRIDDRENTVASIIEDRLHPKVQ